jgi:preprotein translocase subunit SecE
MSCRFYLAENYQKTIWFPSSTVAQLFVGESTVIAAAFKLDSGLGPVVEDEVSVDVPVFSQFVADVTREYEKATHPILRSLIVNFIAVAAVLVARAGGSLPESEPEYAKAWAQLRAQYAQSMTTQ